MPLLPLAAILAAGLIGRCSSAGEPAPPRPNIVFLLADDLGYGDLGCYGQTKIRTPNLDRLAAEGMRFTQHYAGSNVCAPSRCVLMTGLHPGHAYIRGNREIKGREGQEPVPPGALQFPLTLKRLGYTIGGFGKWGLGPVGSTGDPLEQGFDRFFGYNCQRKAHNYYPTYLWDNGRKFPLDNPNIAAHQKLPPGVDPNSPASYARYFGKVYSPDVIAEKARAFVEANRDKPFWLYFPTTVPHLGLEVPEDSLKEYEGNFPEEPYEGGRGYLPQRTPKAAYAAMITRMDREIGRIVQLVKRLGLEERTIFVFTSDNGPPATEGGGFPVGFFNSAGGLHGGKGDFYEGGFREPCIVRWKGHVAAGATSDRVTGFEDWFPTLLELIGEKAATPKKLDGISFAPTLLGKQQPPRPFLYREMLPCACVRVGDWKLIWPHLGKGSFRGNGQRPRAELYNLAKDPRETTDVAADHPQIVAKLEQVGRQQHVKSELFPLPAFDGAAADRRPRKTQRSH
jgi:arylsulfatase A-like enzyme